MISIFLFSFFASAQKLNDWCDVKIGQRVVVTLPGQCDQKRIKLMYGKDAVGEVNSEKDANERIRFADERRVAQEKALRLEDRRQRKVRIQAQCKNETGLMKEICDELINLE